MKHRTKKGAKNAPRPANPTGPENHPGRPGKSPSKPKRCTLLWDAFERLDEEGEPQPEPGDFWDAADQEDNRPSV